MRSLVVFLTLCFQLLFAEGLKHEYKTAYDSTLTSTARVLTLQVPTNNAKFVLFSRLSVYCEQACEFSVERDGTTATGSAVNVSKLNPSASWVAGPTMVAFSASTSTGGTDVSGPNPVSAGGTQVLDIERQVFEAGRNVVQNLTVRVASVSGRVIIKVFSEERARFQ
jgi:hypothetical protein